MRSRNACCTCSFRFAVQHALAKCLLYMLVLQCNMRSRNACCTCSPRRLHVRKLSSLETRVYCPQFLSFLVRTRLRCELRHCTPVHESTKHCTAVKLSANETIEFSHLSVSYAIKHSPLNVALICVFLQDIQFILSDRIVRSSQDVQTSAKSQRPRLCVKGTCTLFHTFSTHCPFTCTSPCLNMLRCSFMLYGGVDLWRGWSFLLTDTCTHALYCTLNTCVFSCPVPYSHPIPMLCISVRIWKSTSGGFLYNGWPKREDTLVSVQCYFLSAIYIIVPNQHISVCGFS